MKFHDTLNDKIWDIENDNQILPEVKDKLEEIASAFIEYLEIPQDAILDKVITGSSASYNYNNFSDLDLHIIVDYDKIHEDCPLVEGYLGALKNTFNKEHDIYIHGIPVELYAEKKDQGTVHNGLYSLNSGWVDFPEKIAPTDNDAAVEAKYNEIKEMVDRCDDSETATELLEKIYTMRKAGLASSGEFCTENLAFKKLRNEGCMDKLREIKKKDIDKQLSLESYNETLEQDVKELTKTDDYYKVDGSRVSIKNGFGSQIELMDLQNLGKKLEKKGYKVYCSNYYIDAKKNESVKEELEEKEYQGCKYTILPDGKYCSIKIYAPKGYSFKNGDTWYSTETELKKADKKAKDIIDNEIELKESIKEDYTDIKPNTKQFDIVDRDGYSIDTLYVTPLENGHFDYWTDQFDSVSEVDTLKDIIDDVKECHDNGPGAEKVKIVGLNKKAFKAKNESIKEGFNKGDKVQLRRKNNKIGIVKSIFNGDKDKNDKNIKYLDVEFEDGTTEGRPASDFKKVNESVKESSIIDNFKEMVNKIAKDFKAKGYPKSKKFLLDFVDEAVKEFEMSNDNKIKVSTDNGTAVLTLDDMYQGRINSQTGKVRFTDLENSNYAYESIKEGLDKMVNKAMNESVMDTDIELIDSWLTKLGFEDAQGPQGYVFMRKTGDKLERIIIDNDKLTYTKGEEKKEFPFSNTIEIQKAFKALNEGKEMNEDLKTIWKNEMKRDPIIDTPDGPVYLQPSEDGKSIEFGTMTNNGMIVDGSVEYDFDYSLDTNLDTVYDEIRDYYELYLVPEEDRDQVVTDEKEDRLSDLFPESKNEDIETLTDKVDQAHNDLKDLIKTLSNKIEEALTEPVEIGTRVGTADGQVTGTVKEVNTVTKEVKIETDEVPGKPKEEKTFKIDQLDNIIKEALQ